MSGQRPIEPKAEKKEKELTMPLEDFIRQRDSVVTGLTNLIGLMQDLNKSYLDHTNAVLVAAGAGPIDSLAVSNFHQITKSLATLPVEGKVKRKRVKKEKDPNAPKRPLTAFFLYSTYARPIVKEDLGGDKAAPVEINSEILSRWQNMSETEKNKWKQEYERNNEKYKEELAAYKAQKGLDAVPIHDDEELESVEDAEAAAEAAAEEESESSEEDESEEEEEAAPVRASSPPKKAAKGGKRKGKENGTATHTASPSPSAQLFKETPVPLPVPVSAKVASPEKRKKTAKVDAQDEPKKKKARKTKSEDVKETTEVVPPSADKKDKKKKRKSDGA